MGLGKLIQNGDPAFAKHCAYEFKAGRVVYGGIIPPSQQVTSIDLCSTPAQTASIQPTGVAWVRSRETVKIPANMVGIWVQTNSLSRRGLLLLNSTLVEPGYEGHVSAHFVNFGSSPVSLSSTTTIAKLLFVELDLNATELIESSQFKHYDAMIDELAAQSNRSFLRIAEIVPDLSRASDASVADAKHQIAAITASSIAEARGDMADLKKETLLKVGGGFVAGLALAAGFSLWMFPKLRAIDIESNDQISKIVLEKNTELSEQIKRLQSDLLEMKSSIQTSTQKSPVDAAKATKAK